MRSSGTTSAEPAAAGAPAGDGRLWPVAALPALPRVLREQRRELIGCVAVGLAGVGLFWLGHRALSDDGYIGLDYARTLALHGRWGLTPGLQSNTATSPLNVLLLAGLMLVSQALSGQVRPMAALGVLTVGSLVAAAWWWLRTCRVLAVRPQAAAFGLGVVVASPLLLSTFGLETVFLVALLLGMLAQAVRARPVAFGVVAGLAVLTRPDAVVFVLVLALGHRAIRTRWWRALLPMLAVSLPWYVWSWTVLGSLVPATLAIKQGQNYPQGWTFASGPVLLVRDSTLPAVVSFVPAALGALALAGWLVARATRRVGGRLGPAAVFAGAGVLYFAVYAFLAVPPYLWYYAPTVVGLDLFLAAAAGALVRRRGLPGPRSGAALGAVLVAAAVAVDLTPGLPWAYPPIFGNYAKPADYARVAEQMRPILHGSAVDGPGELGTLVYYCHCQVLDQFSDPGRTLPYIRAEIDRSGPVARKLLRLNYDNLDRGVRPEPARYHLVWNPGWVPAHPGTWNVSSPASGHGHLTLEPTRNPTELISRPAR